MGTTSNDRFVLRWHELLEDGRADGHWRAIYDVDAFIPRLAMEWLVDRDRWEHRSEDLGHFQVVNPPVGYYCWFQLFHDATGLGCKVYYPLGAKPGEAVTVLAEGAGPRGGTVAVPWVQDRPGLVEWELTPVLERMVVRHEATSC
jgi:hypothetical protein